MNPRYGRVAARAQHRWEYCRAPEAIFNFAFEVEHITPLAHGGEDDFANLALACRSCNLSKGASIHGDDPESQARAPLFHPRQDQWDEHFHIDHARALVIGNSMMGRATVNRLNMNSAGQVAARRMWMRLGLFP